MFYSLCTLSLKKSGREIILVIYIPVSGMFRKRHNVEILVFSCTLNLFEKSLLSLNESTLISYPFPELFPGHFLSIQKNAGTVNFACHPGSTYKRECQNNK